MTALEEMRAKVEAVALDDPAGGAELMAHLLAIVEGMGDRDSYRLWLVQHEAEQETREAARRAVEAEERAQREALIQQRRLVEEGRHVKSCRCAPGVATFACLDSVTQEIVVSIWRARENAAARVSA